MNGEARALVIDELTVTRGGRTLLEGACATFARDVVHAVVGRSGAGKSVLMKAATGLLTATSGTVRLDDVTAPASDAVAFARIRERVVFVHQDPALLDDLTLEENVAFAVARRAPGSAWRERCEHALQALGLVDVRRRWPREVSPGLLRKAALARALVLDPAFLVVDEPTTGIDPVSAREVDRALQALALRGTTLIVVTHDRRSIAALAPRLTAVDAGAVVFQGSVDDARARGPLSLRELLFTDAEMVSPTESP